MDDCIYQQEMIYDVPDDYCEPLSDDNVHRKPKSRTSRFDLAGPLLTVDKKPYLNKYRVSGFHGVETFNFPAIEATSSAEAEETVQAWMNFGARITSCRMV